jgi:hypothetical protein
MELDRNHYKGPGLFCAAQMQLSVLTSHAHALTQGVSAPHQNNNITKTIIYPTIFSSILNSPSRNHILLKFYEKLGADIKKALVHHKSNLKLEFTKLIKIYNIL